MRLGTCPRVAPHPGGLPSVPLAHQAPKPELARLQYREVTPEDYELLCLLDEEIPKRGRKTPEALVAGLPRLRAGEDGACRQCQICLTPLAADALVFRLPCQHAAFHPACITQWLTEYSGTCPLCLRPVDPLPGAANGYCPSIPEQVAAFWDPNHHAVTSDSCASAGGSFDNSGCGCIAVHRVSV